MELPDYHPDEARIEALTGMAEGLDVWLGREDIYALEYLALCADLRPQGLKINEIRLAVHESDLRLYPRLLGLEEYGLIEHENGWEQTSPGFSASDEYQVTYWKLTAAGESVIILIEDAAALGPRSRPSALAAESG